MTTNYEAAKPGESDETTTEFEVSDGGTLRIRNYVEAKTRADFYGDVAEFWSGEPKNLADAMSECEPLAWAVHAIYSDFREELEGELEDAQDELNAEEAEDLEGSNRQKLADLQVRFNALPEDPQEGATDWLLSLSSEEFESRVVPEIETWFSQAPNWNFEDDYLPQTCTAQGAALEFFRDMSDEDLEALCIDIVEGDRPGSTYYAAELRGDVDRANRAAEAAGIPVCFFPARN